MLASTHDCSGRDAARPEHGVAERADRVGDRATGEHGGLRGAGVEVGAEDGHRRVVADEPDEVLAHVARRVDAGVDEEGVAGLDAELLAPLLVDHRVDLGHLRRERPDVDAGGVLVVAELEVALAVLEATPERLVDGQLAAGHPVPDLLELGRLPHRVVAVGRRIDRGDGDDTVLHSEVTQGDPLHPVHPPVAGDALHELVAERLLGVDPQVRPDQRAGALPGRVDGVLGVGDRGGGGAVARLVARAAPVRWTRAWWSRTDSGSACRPDGVVRCRPWPGRGRAARPPPRRAGVVLASSLPLPQPSVGTGCTTRR